MPKRNANLTNDTLTPNAELLFALRPFIDLLARQAVREFVATNDNGVQRADVVCAH